MTDSIDLDQQILVMYPDRSLMPPPADDTTLRENALIGKYLLKEWSTVRDFVDRMKGRHVVDLISAYPETRSILLADDDDVATWIKKPSS